MSKEDIDALLDEVGIPARVSPQDPESAPRGLGLHCRDGGAAPPRALDDLN